jgi:hypothetical protein
MCTKLSITTTAPGHKQFTNIFSTNTRNTSLLVEPSIVMHPKNPWRAYRPNNTNIFAFVVVSAIGSLPL